jgi:hypothetical protein
MSKTWKWILGIFVVLVVAAVVVGAVFVWRNHAAFVAVPRVRQFGPNDANGSKGPLPGWDGHRMPGGEGWQSRGFPRFGMGFFLLGGLLRLIFPLGVLALVAYVFYRMGKQAGLSSVHAASTPAAPPAPADAAPAGKGRKVAKDK